MEKNVDLSVIKRESDVFEVKDGIYESNLDESSSAIESDENDDTERTAHDEYLKQENEYVNVKQEFDEGHCSSSKHDYDMTGENASQTDLFNFSEKTLSSPQKCDFTTSIITPIDGKYPCSDCDYSAKTIDELATHSSIHIKQRLFVCGDCKFVTTSEIYLHQHRQCHSKPYSCNECDYTATSKANFRIHMYKHENVKPFACSECDYATTSKHVLKRHMNCHLTEKPYVCTVCGHSTTTKRYLQIHMLVHSKEKPFACNECNYTAAKRDNLRKHKISNHTANRVKRFVCPECNYATHKKYNLQTHLLTHSKEKLKKLPTTCVQYM